MEMKNKVWWLGVAAFAMLCGTASWWATAGSRATVGSSADNPSSSSAAKLVPIVDPKPLSGNVKKGLEWLVEHQLPSGAWGQGEESAQMGGGAALKDVPSIADTSVAALALMRAGNTPAKGPYAASVKKAVDYICKELESADSDSLYVTQQRNTRVQTKLGQYIDTFMSAMLLAEVKGVMGDKSADQRVTVALDKTLAKIQKNQRKDGTWESNGWATSMSQGMATKALNKGAQVGGIVDEESRAKAEGFAQRQLDAKTGKFALEQSAGIELYSAANSVSNMRDSQNVNEVRWAEAEKKLANAKDDKERADARKDLDRFARNGKELEKAEAVLIEKLNDQRFISGFGSNGGEEFLSYMSIGEALIMKGGDEWTKWDKSMTESMNRIQNQDGSWTGHHCITGRTFCTAAAVLVLTVDRATVPVSSQARRR
jgi:hypothetical protein